MRPSIGSFTQYAEQLKRSRLVAAFSVALSGNALAQMIALAAVPLLSRLYGPDEFGVLASIAAIVGVLGPVCALTYERAIPLASSDGQAFLLACISFFVVIASTLIIATGSYLVSESVLSFQNYHFVFVGCFLLSLLQILHYWMIRKKQYRKLAANRVIQSGSTVSTQILAGSVALGATGLIAGYLAGFLAAVAFLGVQFLQVVRKMSRGVTVFRLATTLRRFWRFPLVQAPSTLITSGGWLLPPVLIAALYDVRTAGIFFMAERITIVPTVLVGQAASQVFYGESARMAPSALSTRSLKVQGILGAAGIAIACAVAVFAELLLVPTLGAVWSEAKWPIIWMGLTIPPMLSIYPVAQFNLVNRQDLHLWWATIRLLLTVGSLYIPFILGASGMTAILSFALGTILSYLLMMVFWHIGLKSAQTAETGGVSP